MNRKQRREFTRQAKKNGISKEGIEAYLKAQELGLKQPIPTNDFNEGDKVMLDLDRIQSHSAYDNMSQTYRDFVTNNADKIFTAHLEKEDLVSLAEHPEWLFWSGDLKAAE